MYTYNPVAEHGVTVFSDSLSNTGAIFGYFSPFR